MRWTSKYREIAITIIALLLISAALFIYTRFNPEDSILFPRCIFLMLTGFQCPGCGSQRAIHQLLNGNIAEAFSYNALMVLSIPYLLLWVVLRIFIKKSPSAGRLEEKLYHGPAVIIVLIFIIAFWIIRNIL